MKSSRVILLITMLAVGCDGSPPPPQSSDVKANGSATTTAAAAPFEPDTPQKAERRSAQEGSKAAGAQPERETPKNSDTKEPDAAGAPAPAVRSLVWDDLLPANFNPEELFDKANDLYAKSDVANMKDSDKRTKEVAKRLRKLWLDAPVVPALDGQLVKLPGFAIPLEGSGKNVRSFILVPYYGACIHVPPPPANQTVIVQSPRGAEIKEAFDTVWVTGRMSVKRVSTEMADAGYTLTAEKVEPYAQK